MKYLYCTDKLQCSLDKYFPDAVDEYFEDYIKYLEEKAVHLNVIKNVKSFYYNIHICLEEYYYGQHGSAREFFDKAMEYIDIEKLCNEMSEKILYRARNNERKKDDSCVWDKEEMFHIPFEKRYIVSTERYSFPGLPCLYLGVSYEVCCEELKKWKNLLIAEIKKNEKNKVYILDLSFFDKYDIVNISSEDREHIYGLWPIVACCSFSFKENEQMAFRPDYILPQFLLEYIIDTNFEKRILGIDKNILGIRYRTVKKPFLCCEETKFDNRYVNYVFPALSNGKKGHCPVLKECFQVTDVFRIEDK